MWSRLHPPKATEYQLVSPRCGGCGHVNDPAATDVPARLTPAVTWRVTPLMPHKRPVPRTKPVPRNPPRSLPSSSPLPSLALRPPRGGRIQSRGGIGVTSGKPGPDRPANHRAGGVADVGIIIRSGGQSACWRPWPGLRCRPGSWPVSEACRGPAGSRIPIAPASPVTPGRGIVRR